MSDCWPKEHGKLLVPLDISKLQPARRAAVEMLQALPKRGVCAEIGVATGGFSSFILRVSQPIELFLIDTWQGREQWSALPGEAEKQAIAGGEDVSSGDQNYNQVVTRFKNVKRVKILRKAPIDASKEFKDSYLDWAYFDADRHYDTVCEVIRHWWPKIRMGGFLCGDGYRLVKTPEATKSKLPNGVRFAVDEFVKKESLTIKLFPKEGVGNAHFMIWKNS